MKAAVFLNLFGLALASSAIAASQTLDNAVDAAFARSPMLKAAHAHIDGASSRFAEIRAQRYPRLAIRSSYTRSDNPVYAFGSLLEQASFGQQNFAIDALNNPSYLTNIKNALDLGVPLFAGFQIAAGEEISRYGRALADAEFSMAAQHVRFQAIQAYLDVLLKIDAVAAVEQRVDSAAKEIDGARRLNAKGLVLGSDFYAAEAMLSSLKARQVQAQQKLATARQRLAVMTGLSVEDSGPDGHIPAADYAVGEEAELVEAALRNRQDVAGASLHVQMARVGAKQAARGYLPSIEAFASVETNTEDFESNPTNRMVGVRSHFPIGDPAYFSRKSGAKASAAAATGQKEQLEESIRVEVVEARNQLTGALASVALMREARQQAEKSLNLFRPLYREGRQSILDVVRAEDGLLQAHQGLLETYFHVHMGYARLMLATGRLEPSVVAEIQRHLEARP